ncbi:HD domain-containing phosphohydrolase [Rheinheimera sp. 4Y26]|uniref:HD domain-containing phosphohydrolase n=1 Tax=Rheinheimera sp. 4Y26 TaxID=2977811 RepID=UPI0021B0E9A8|nr:HD domain-containing phosphohydrolase [Rheinheimera sp. 4Y26]MCT6699997.1 Hpt domain-containing protein [Rheinheimera sp. 4Y26]
MSQLNLNRPDDLQRDCVDDFFEDFRDAYEQCESTLLELEQHPQQPELLHGIFRVVHTIKGNLGFIGLFSLIPLLQSLEDVLDDIRKGHMAYDSALCDVIQLTLDRTRQWVEASIHDSAKPMTTTALQQICQRLTGLTSVDERSRTVRIRQVLGLLDPNHPQALAIKDEVPDLVSSTVGAPDSAGPKSASAVDACRRLLQYYRIRMDADLEFFIQLLPALEERHPNWQGRAARQLFLALEMNRLAGGKVDQLQLVVAVMLHDIGMAFLPLQMLDAQGRADPAQLSVWQRHVEMGASLVASSPRWQDAAAMIWQHHEHQDGSGFPHQMAAEDISDGARLLRIVDEFDLLTSQQQAQETNNRQLIKALVEINQGAGTKFDPFWVSMLSEAVKLHKQHFQR